MGLFDRRPKFFPGGKSQNESDDFDFDSFDDMADEFSDEHKPAKGRKASTISYVQNHYAAKLDDRNERKRILKKALPSSYSGTIDLGYDLKDDYDSIKRDLDREWVNIKSPLKTALKKNDKILKFLRMKKLSEWANQEERRSYQDEQINHDDAMVASMLSEFTSPAAIKEKTEQEKLNQAEREDAAEYREQSLTAQIQSTTNTGNVVSELRKMNNYQDQVTYLYQKKSLEIGIRSLIEHRKQTDILGVYKTEAIAELKEIHKNTGLPDSVKANTSEVTGQFLRQRMLGSMVGQFDGKFAAVRKRIMTKARDRLVGLAKEAGAALGSFNEMDRDAHENNSSMIKMLLQGQVDDRLDSVYNKVLDGPLGKIRNKLTGNAKFNKFGRTLNALTKRSGLIGNKILNEGTGNATIDSALNFLGITGGFKRNDTMRQGVANNLDVATHMDLRFKQTVERIIPKWLSMLYRETHAIRKGMSFDLNKESDVEYSWRAENMVSKDEARNDVFARAFNKDRIKDYGESLDRLLTFMGAGALDHKAKTALKEWVIKRSSESKTFTLYDLGIDLPKFSRRDHIQLSRMISWKSGIDVDILNSLDDPGMLAELKLMNATEKYKSWLVGFSRHEEDFLGKSLIDWTVINQLVAEGQEEILEEIGLVNRGSDGSILANVGGVNKLASGLTQMQTKERIMLKDGETETFKMGNRTYTRRVVEVDESKTKDYEAIESSDPELVKSVGKTLERLLDAATLNLRSEKEGKKKSLADNLRFMTDSEAKELGVTKASGGFIPSFAKGGPTGDEKGAHEEIEATLHGGEFVSDKATTSKNRKLLHFMNKFKAPVLLPDGTVNPVYAEAFGIEANKQRVKKGTGSLLDAIRKHVGDEKVDSFEKNSASMVKKAKQKVRHVSKKVSAMSEPQAEKVFWILAEKVDPAIVTEEDHVYLEDASVLWRDKIKYLTNISIRRGSKKDLVAEFDSAFKTLGDTGKAIATSVLKGEGIGEEGKEGLNKIKDGVVNKAQNVWDDREKVLEFALAKTRTKKGYELALKAWRDKAVDIYLPGSTESPRLTAIGFASGDYIDQESGRVCSSHHDITGPVINKTGDVLININELDAGFVDKEGNPIRIDMIRRARNVAKEQVSAAYNKYAKKHVDKLGKGLLSITEKWQNLFKNTAIDLYIGEASEPRLTAVNFKEGKYLSKETGKVLKGYLDIDGTIIDDKGNIVVTKDELTSIPLLDKDQNVIKPPKLMSTKGRLLSIASNAMGFGMLKKAGKLGFGKLKDLKNKTKEEYERLKEEERLKKENGESSGNPLLDKVKEKLGGSKDGEKKGLRIGSWQWKRAERDKDSWIGKLAGAIRGGDKPGPKKKKTSWIAKILGGMWKLGGILSGAFMGATKWLAVKAAWIASKLISGPLLTMLGKLGGLPGLAGKGLRVAGAVAGGAMLYNGLKGKVMTDENGNPILDENGEQVVERNYGTAAAGAALTVASVAPGLALKGAMWAGGAALSGAGAIGSGLATAAGFLAPFALPLAAAATVGYGAYKLFGWMKRKGAEKEYPVTAFRYYQYGFAMTDTAIAEKIGQLEAMLKPFITYTGEKAAFKSDVDVNAVFGLFGLKFQGGDEEKNKRFLTWFLGRFRPVYLAYCTQLNKMKKNVQFSELDKSLLASERLELITKSHFANQFDANPYNVMIGPDNDYDECDYDFEGVADKFENVSDILTALAAKEPKKDEAGTETAAEAEESSMNDTLNKAAMVSPLGGIVAGSLYALKKLGTGASNILNATGTDLGKKTAGFIDSLMSKAEEAINKAKGFIGSISDGVSDAYNSAKDGVGGALSAAGEAAGNAVNTVGNTISSAASDTWEGVKETASSVFGGKKSADIAKVIEVGKGYNVVQTKDGSIIKQTGAWNWRNNNPGNISDGKWARRHGAIDQGKVVGKTANRFAVFPTYAVGRQAKAALIFNGENYKNLDAMAAIARYAPPHENNTANYQRTVIAAAGSNKLMKDYTNDERIKILNAMEKLEGMKAGSVQVIQKGTGPVGTPAQSTGVMKSDATTGGAAAGGSNAPAAVAGKATSMVGNATAKVSGTSPASPSVATPTNKTVAGTEPAKASAATKLINKELIALGKTHYTIAKNTTLTGMNQLFMDLFFTMIGEAKKRGLLKVHITEGVRTLAEQWRLYNLYKAGKGALAAYPGKSKHGKGTAMDMNTPNADQLDHTGLLSKYGFHRPLMRRLKNGKRTEQWHIENKFVSGGKVSMPPVNDQTSKTAGNVTKQTGGGSAGGTSTGNVTKQTGGGSAGGSAGGMSTGNAALDSVVKSGGAGSTGAISYQQSSGGWTRGDTQTLTKQLSVQTEMLSAIVQIKDYLMQKQTSELEQLKKPKSFEEVGKDAISGITDVIAEKLGLNKAKAEKSKPTPIVSTKKI